MGMFDTLYDADGHGWQTKAFDRALDEFNIGDTLPTGDHPDTYQVMVLGDPRGSFIDSLATVRERVLVAVPVDRDPALPLVHYCGGVIEAGRGS